MWNTNCMYDIMNYQIIQKSEEAYVMSMMDVQVGCQDKVPVSETLQDMANEQAAFGVKGKIKDSEVAKSGEFKLSKVLLLGVAFVALVIIICLLWNFWLNSKM